MLQNAHLIGKTIPKNFFTYLLWLLKQWLYPVRRKVILIAKSHARPPEILAVLFLVLEGIMQAFLQKNLYNGMYILSNIYIIYII